MRGRAQHLRRGATRTVAVARREAPVARVVTSTAPPGRPARDHLLERIECRRAGIRRYQAAGRETRSWR